MLVLSRKPGEELEIGDNIRLTIVEISGNKARLGIEAPRDIAIRRPDAKRKTAPPRDAETRALRILVVDDNREDRDAYRRIINSGSDREYLIEQAESGEEGLAVCRSNLPDCLLLDYMLPDLNGLEFLTELTGHTGDAPFPVVMLTGQGDEMIAVRALKGGADDYIVKRNITGEGLRGAVQDAIARAARRHGGSGPHSSMQVAG
jgi:carbon storage regulator CsrA